MSLLKVKWQLYSACVGVWMCDQITIMEEPLCCLAFHTFTPKVAFWK